MWTTTIAAETTQAITVTGSGKSRVQHTPEDVTLGGATEEGIEMQLLDVWFGGRTGLERRLYDHKRTTVYKVLYGIMMAPAAPGFA